MRSAVATRFRQWATERLMEYLVKGFTLDDERLKGRDQVGDYFDELLARIRDIRASEKRVYQRIREIFALAADYREGERETQVFFATMQNKMHYATTGLTAAEIVRGRADAGKANMGLTAWRGGRVIKGDVGTAKNYLNPKEIDTEGFRNAAQIGGRVLGFLRKGAEADGRPAPARTVVTVPASFGAAQRAATLHAAELAGLQTRGGDLLDEPIAAFIDAMMTREGVRERFEPGAPKNLLVFDFGGGTCDVAVFRAMRSSEERFGVTPLAVSRYHRLGGGDIDAAILHEVLMAQLLDQNGLDPGELDFEDRKRVISRRCCRRRRR